MGVPGRSAFSPYVRPPPPQPRWFSPGPSGSGNAGGGYGFPGALGVPVGGSGSGGVAAPEVQIGGSAAARKRVRDGGEAAGGGNPPRDVAPNRELQCSICGKVFLTPKALFGHMRSHPGRGWRGARPPPTFRADK